MGVAAAALRGPSGTGLRGVAHRHRWPPLRL